MAVSGVRGTDRRVIPVRGVRRPQTTMICPLQCARDPVTGGFFLSHASLLPAADVAGETKYIPFPEGGHSPDLAICLLLRRRPESVPTVRGSHRRITRELNFR